MADGQIESKKTWRKHIILPVKNTFYLPICPCVQYKISGGTKSE